MFTFILDEMNDDVPRSPVRYAMLNKEDERDDERLLEDSDDEVQEKNGIHVLIF